MAAERPAAKTNAKWYDSNCFIRMVTTFLHPLRRHTGSFICLAGRPNPMLVTGMERNSLLIADA